MNRTCRGSKDVTGDSDTWIERLKATPLAGTVSLLLRDEDQVPPIGAQVSFTFEEGAGVGLQVDPKGEWQITHHERVDLPGTTAIVIAIMHVMVRGSG